MRVAIIGGGAAGYFAAIAVAKTHPDAEVQILEGSRRTLTKVRISGGGRCNVTHACFEPKALTQSYPRGHRELLGAFHRFQPEDTVRWFAAHGIELKREDDGRMFPTTNDSETIARCLEDVARAAGVVVRLGCIVSGVRREDEFIVSMRGSEESFTHVILATGSAPIGHTIARSLGHRMVDPVPSLFTFNISDPRLEGQAGISFERVAVTLVIGGEAKPRKFKQSGPLLITHWGLSGPAVLKLSAWAARELYETNYQATLVVQFLDSVDEVQSSLMAFKNAHPKKLIGTETPVAIPKRYWQRMVELCIKDPHLTWSHLNRASMQKLTEELCQASFIISGKGVFKEEFVTAGGVALEEVDFRNMQSRRIPGLYFAGEILDVDGVTGGFNFQNAWTTAWIAGTQLHPTRE